MADMTNLPNPVNGRDDIEERNQPHTTQIPAQAQADDLFDDTMANPAPEQPEHGQHRRLKERCGPPRGE